MTYDEDEDDIIATTGWWSGGAKYGYIVQARTHGIRSTYTHGCRCPLCRAAEMRYRREYRYKTPRNAEHENMLQRLRRQRRKQTENA